MQRIIRKTKEYYPLIVLVMILFLLLIDIQNYYVLTIFSNVFGFSFLTNNLIKEKYKNNYICTNSIYALNFINITNIIGCFFSYEYYIKILIIVSVIAVLIVSTYQNGRQHKI
jgi:hypothetical protein